MSRRGGPSRVGRLGGDAAGGAVVPAAVREQLRRLAPPPVVTVCGSMRFWPLMQQMAQAFTAAGEIVLAPFVIAPPNTAPPNTAQPGDDTNGGDGGGAVGDLVGDLERRLDRLARGKIALSTRVVVVTDRSGYWGASTAAEIGYAHRLRIPVIVAAVDGRTVRLTPLSAGGGRPDPTATRPDHARWAGGS